MRRIFSMPYLLWYILALPLIPMALDYAASADPPREAFRALISPSGQYGAFLILIALIATPLSMLLRGWSGPRWLVRNRRAIGVAGFCYATLHTFLYLGWRGRRAIYEVFSLPLGSGWLGLLILIPIAFTSNDKMVRRLGRRWKSVQRLSYLAVALTFLHWVTLHDGRLIPIALAAFVPFFVLEFYRVRRNLGARQMRG